MELQGEELVAFMLAFVTERHAGQQDAAGEPYIGHLIRVKNYAEELRSQHCPDMDEHLVGAAALGHDVVEDGHASFEELLEAGVPSEVVEALQSLTHRKGETRAAYISRALKNRLANLVKLADNTDNGNPERLKKVTDPARKARLGGKYGEEEKLLKAGLGISAPVSKTIER